MSSFIPRNLTEMEAITGCTFACICNTVFRMFSCLQINCQPFYLRQLLKFHQFDWLIEIYLQTEGQGTHHKMVSLQPMSGFSPLLQQNIHCYIALLDAYYITKSTSGSLMSLLNKCFMTCFMTLQILTKNADLKKRVARGPPKNA